MNTVETLLVHGSFAWVDRWMSTGVWVCLIQWSGNKCGTTWWLMVYWSRKLQLCIDHEGVVASAAVVFGTADCHVRDYIQENTSLLVIYWFMYLTQLISGWWKRNNNKKKRQWFRDLLGFFVGFQALKLRSWSTLNFWPWKLQYMQKHDGICSSNIWISSSVLCTLELWCVAMGKFLFTGQHLFSK